MVCNVKSTNGFMGTVFRAKKMFSTNHCARETLRIESNTTLCSAQFQQLYNIAAISPVFPRLLDTNPVAFEHSMGKWICFVIVEFRKQTGKNRSRRVQWEHRTHYHILRQRYKLRGFRLVWLIVVWTIGTLSRALVALYKTKNHHIENSQFISHLSGINRRDWTQF